MLNYSNYPMHSLEWNNHILTLEDLSQKLTQDWETMPNVKTIEFILFAQHNEGLSSKITPILEWTTGADVKTLLTPYYNLWVNNPINKIIHTKNVFIVFTTR